MATYINQITDYIPQIQPFQPDYNFLANVLQTRQSRYDSNYNQLSSVYTSLYNSPMMRDVDIARKDAFFKTIDQDIKKVSGLDLSLQQNVDTASKVFQPFYEDKNLVNDMVKTKQYQNAISKSESFKNCVDPSKCGGQYWEKGVAELNYKASEFKNTTDEQALGFQMPDYTPYYNWKKEAIKLAKELDFNVTQEGTNGQYIVKDTNGNLVKGGLYNLYKTQYGDDPRVSANYKTEAYVQRKQTVESTIGQYGSEENAERVYINDMINNSSQRVTKLYNQFNGYSEEVGEKINAMKQKDQSSGLTPDEAEGLQLLMGTKQSIDNTAKSLEETHNSIHNNSESTELNVLRQRADSAAAFELEERDMTELAGTMSLRGMKHEISADPYGVGRQAADLSLRNSMMMGEFNRKTGLMNISAKHAADLDLLDHKSGVISGVYNPAPVVITNKGYSTTLPVEGEVNSTGYTANVETANQFEAEAKAGSEEFLLGAFYTAKIAADGGKVSAQNYLKNTFGNDWSKLKTKDDLVNYLTKTGKTTAEVFQTTVDSFNEKKNPTTDLSWASSFITNKGAMISDIKLKEMAKESAAENIVGNNKKIVKSIQGQSGPGNYVFHDADLLLSPAGYVLSEDDFNVKYKQRYGSKGDAETAYERLSTKFFDTYNTTPGIMLNQGAGLGTGNTIKGDGLHWENVTPKQFQAPAFTNLFGLLNDFTNPNQSALVTAIPGQPDKDNIEGSTTSPELMGLISQIKSDLGKGSTYKGKDLTISYDENPVVGNDKNKSALTLYVNQAYLDQFFGTVKSPKPLDKYKDQLSEGITLWYDNNQVKTSTTDFLKADALETVVKTSGYIYDSFPKGGTIELKYDPSTNMVRPETTIIKYDPNTHKKIYDKQSGDAFPISQLASQNKVILEYLKSMQDYNIKMDGLIAADQKSKQLSAAQTPKQ